MKSSRILLVSTLAAAAYLMQAMPVYAEETLLRADDYISYDSQGNAVCTVNGVVKTGKFSLEPSYTLGDVGQDGTVNSFDAAEILHAAVDAGTGSGTVEEVISGSHSELTDESVALRFGDINSDGKIDASDAAQILVYTAGLGSGAEGNALGFAYYYADENGFLQKGLIQTGGKTYYADENYQLLTGWQEINQHQYYFTEDGSGYTGWLTQDEKKYYFRNGLPETGVVSINFGLYYFGSDGVQKTGFQQADTGNYYYFDSENNGAAVKNGWRTINGQKYYFDASYVMQTGLTHIGDSLYYFNEEGILQYGEQSVDGTIRYFDPETGEMWSVGWMIEDDKVYYLGNNGTKYTGWLTEDGKQYYFDETTKEAASGWKFINGAYYYFSPEDHAMVTGWLTLDEGKYYLDEDGKRHYGFLEYEGNTYCFGENGILIVNKTTSAGTYDENGIFTPVQTVETPSEPVVNYDFPIDTATRTMLDNAVLNPGIRSIPVYDRQTSINDDVTEFTIRLSDEDYEIIEAFAAEHFTSGMTMAEKLYVTWDWIHTNTTYASGDLWYEIDSLTYPDAIFNHQLGQCVQYNGAMAAVLAYYGFDVYMVKGWVYPAEKRNQHYWTEVIIDGERYCVETGNLKKNGSYWKHFFDDADSVEYSAK